MLRWSSIVAATLLACGTAWADPIEGKWKTQSGETATVTSCGDDFCITMMTGRHAGKQVGKVTGGDDGNYSGFITDLDENETYQGSARLSGNTARLSGCVLGGLICKSQDWTKL